MNKTVFMLDSHLDDDFFASHQTRCLRTLPRELVALEPQVLTHLRAGVCEHALWMEYLATHHLFDAVIVTTHCDQMRRMAEGVDRLFLYNVPQCPSAGALDRYERQRLGAYLEACEAHDYTYACAQGVYPKRGYTPLALVGSPLLLGCEKLELFLNEYGATLALNLCENAQELNHYTHPFSRPNDCFYRQLNDVIVEHAIAGVIVSRTAWCDVYRGVAARLKEVLNVPVIEWVMSVGEHALDEPRVQTRLGAFLEGF